MGWIRYSISHSEQAANLRQAKSVSILNSLARKEESRKGGGGRWMPVMYFTMNENKHFTTTPAFNTLLPKGGELITIDFLDSVYKLGGLLRWTLYCSFPSLFSLSVPRLLHYPPVNFLHLSISLTVYAPSTSFYPFTLFRFVCWMCDPVLDTVLSIQTRTIHTWILRTVQITLLCPSLLLSVMWYYPDKSIFHCALRQWQAGRVALASIQHVYIYHMAGEGLKPIVRGFSTSMSTLTVPDFWRTVMTQSIRGNSPDFPVLSFMVAFCKAI